MVFDLGRGTNLVDQRYACVYNCIITYTPFPLFQVVSLFLIAPVTDPCRNTRNPANQIVAYRSARANQTPAY